MVWLGVVGGIEWLEWIRFDWTGSENCGLWFEAGGGGGVLISRSTGISGRRFREPGYLP